MKRDTEYLFVYVCTIVGSSLPIALQNFRKIIVPEFCNSFSHARFSDLVQYVMKTVFQHIHLYQYVLIDCQQADVLTLQVKVEIPKKEVCSLKDGIQEKEFMKNKILDELQDNYEKRLKELEDEGLTAIDQAKENLRNVYVTKFTGIPQRRRMMSAEKLSSILSSVVDTCVEPTVQILSQKLQKHEEYMKFRVDRIKCLSVLNEDSAGMANSKATPIHHLRSSVFKSNQKHHEFKHY